MTMPSSQEIERWRADIESAALPDTCVVLSATRVPDGQGGFTQTWGTVLAGLACRLDEKTGMESVAGGALRPYTYWSLTLPYGTTLTASNRVQIGTVVYSVTEVDTGKSWSACVRAKVARI